MVVKGILSVADALAAVDAGADALVLSNHGGRQLDRAPVPLELLPDVVDAVGTGSRCTSTRESARAVTSPRPSAGSPRSDGRTRLPLRPHGRRAAGCRGARSTCSSTSCERAMCLLGTPTVAAIGREHVRLRDRR